MSRQVIDIGDMVVCDLCNEEYTGKPDPGGFLFQSKAVCPACAPKFERDVRKFQEEHLIRARCPEGQPFAAWVLSLRGGDNTIQIITGEDL